MKKSSKIFAVVLLIITMFMIVTVTSYDDIGGIGYSGDYEYIITYNPSFSNLIY